MEVNNKFLNENQIKNQIESLNQKNQQNQNQIQYLTKNQNEIQNQIQNLIKVRYK